MNTPVKYMPMSKHGLFQNLVGAKFGRLTVAGYLGRIGANNCWDCICECGNHCTVNGGNLKTGHSQSCGCLQKEVTSQAQRTHGKSNTDEYRVWSGMKTRCYDKDDIKYYRYGARGIIVCDQWLHSFENFITDMGTRPSKKHSIDRVDNDGNYEPSNCRWATDKEQANNRSSTVFLNINGATKPLSIWCDEVGIERSVVVSRYVNGKTGADLIKPSGYRAKMISFNGITDTCTGWSRRTGLKPETIYQRVTRNGWTTEKALTEGISK